MIRRNQGSPNTKNKTLSWEPKGQISKRKGRLEGGESHKIKGGRSDDILNREEFVKLNPWPKNLNYENVRRKK